MILAIGFACYFGAVALIVIAKLAYINDSLNLIAKAADAAAFALCDEHDWKVEDRDNRTIDDLPPGRIVD